MTIFINFDGCGSKLSALEQFALPWGNAAFLEPIIARAVNFKRTVQAWNGVTDHHLLRTDVLQLVADGISIARDLETVATSVRCSEDPDIPLYQQPRAFNNMFEVSTKTTEAIVRSLYRSLRYHIVELVLGLLGSIDDEGYGITQKAIHQFDPSVRGVILDDICEDICAILMLDGRLGMEGDKVGMAYRAFVMFWPLANLFFSSFAGEEKRAWFQDKLRFIGNKSGLGVATWAAELTNMIIPISLIQTVGARKN